MAITTEAELRALIGAPSENVVVKITDRLNELTRTFIEEAPMVMVATSDGAGSCDVSPRGDGPGFVRILDDRTLLLPERPGNRIADTLRNILTNPHVGLLFVIPGIGDTFRVNGRAELVTDADLLEASTVEGKAPKLGIRIEIDEAYTQCSKAFLRSDLWNPAGFRSRDEFPSHGEIHARIRGDGYDAAAHDAERTLRYSKREGFY
jgi:uncharacterized protein